MTLTLYWPDLATFVKMGGHAVYVWGAFGATALALVLDIASVRAPRRRAGAPR